PLLYPSITTVAGMRAKDFLQGWYATMASKRALEMYSWLDRNPGRAPVEIARVSRDKWGTQKRIPAAAEEHTRAAGDFGTLVHTACEQLSTGGTRPTGTELGELDATMRPQQGGFAAERIISALHSRADGGQPHRRLRPHHRRGREDRQHGAQRRQQDLQEGARGLRPAGRRGGQRRAAAR